ncbi:glycosyltransferase [Geomonas oryzisoli]|uniref:Glycosyltransferase n=1 Tax=Geomonas oryzisoli TaxID=2847992 RepID=A0ABX8J0U1_9BACT|nr:glycosyltransferase [Geomonas oryzisoli]QWV91840.1 glycosyltransferase [Geomonas oryzisoli]
MKITIVIPVLNGIKYIGQCVVSLRQMDTCGHVVDIIVVDNGSSDGTVELLKELGVFCTVHRGVTVSQLRNIGAGYAVGPFVGFVDSDCLVRRDWLVKALEVMASDDRIGVVGSFYGVGDDPTWVEELWCDRKGGIEGGVAFLPAGNMFVRKDLFDALGGFSTTLVTGEDYEFCRRVRSCDKLVFSAPSVAVKHLGNVKMLRDIVRKERWYGLGMFAGNVFTSKPLISSFAFVLLCAGTALSLLFAREYLAVLLALLFALLVVVSLGFCRTAQSFNLVKLFQFLPISACYMLGRFLSVWDLVMLKSKRTWG